MRKWRISIALFTVMVVVTTFMMPMAVVLGQDSGDVVQPPAQGSDLADWLEVLIDGLDIGFFPKMIIKYAIKYGLPWLCVTLVGMLKGLNLEGIVPRKWFPYVSAIVASIIALLTGGAGADSLAIGVATGFGGSKINDIRKGKPFSSATKQPGSR